MCEHTKIEIQQVTADCLADTCISMYSMKSIVPLLKRVWQLAGGSGDEFDKVGLSRNTMKRFLQKTKKTNFEHFTQVADTLARAGMKLY